MIQNLKKLFIYLLLLPSTFTFPINGNRGYAVPAPTVDDAAVEKELLTYAKLLEKIPNDVDRAEFRGRFKEVLIHALKASLKADILLQDATILHHQKEVAEEWAWFELMRQQIEYFEENNFPQPSDVDFESKKIVWNKERLKGKSNFELHEERRYQKFKYYLEHPPNEAVQKLCDRLNIANISVEVFSRGVAKAYRLISAKIHSGYIKWLDKNLDEFFIEEEVMIAMVILLDEMGISKKLIKKMENGGSKTKLIVNDSQKQ